MADYLAFSRYSLITLFLSVFSSLKNSLILIKIFFSIPFKCSSSVKDKNRHFFQKTKKLIDISNKLYQNEFKQILCIFGSLININICR